MAISTTFIAAICVLSNLHSNSVQGVLNEKRGALSSLVWLSKQTQPLLQDGCQNFGNNRTSEMNFAKVNQSDVANNAMLRALFLLKRTKCSKFIMSFACAIFQPYVSARYRAAVPPCRSVCDSITKSCFSYLKLATYFLPFPQGMYSCFCPIKQDLHLGIELHELFKQILYVLLICCVSYCS